MEELNKIEEILLTNLKSNFKNSSEDSEASDYFGYNFEINDLLFKYRKAKITPKKIGQFVTLWKRNTLKQTEPFDESDPFDFYLIVTEEMEKYGFFLFPKNILVKRQILSTTEKEGKRGFRVYPAWTKAENKQAIKTQMWQTSYFFDFTENHPETKQRLIHLLGLG